MQSDLVGRYYGIARDDSGFGTKAQCGITRLAAAHRTRALAQAFGAGMADRRARPLIDHYRAARRLRCAAECKAG